MVPTSIQKKNSAFTLVELVVVITILAILGTIGFLSVGGYSSRARDSERTADVALASKSLDLGIITSGSYPIPDNYFTVTYSGGTVWYQWTIGNGVVQKLHGSIAGGGLDSRPTDPLKGTEFTYSSLAFGKAYQIKTEYEGDTGIALGGLVQETFAAPGMPTLAYIKGNYGGLTAKTVVPNGSGSITYVLAVPSIVTGTGTMGQVLEISASTLSWTLLFHGKNLSGTSGFNPNAVVFSGASLPKDDSTGQLTSIVNTLKTAYSGSDLASTATISALLSTTGSTQVSSLGATILTGQLGGTANSGTSGGGGGGVSQCSAGTYSVTGNAPCTTTTAGYYTSTAGTTSQTACTAGYYCPAGSTSSTQTQCPANNYCPAASGTPTMCPNGNTSPAGSTSSAACVPATLTVTTALSNWLSSNGYAAYGQLTGNLILTQSIPANEHIYVYFDSVGTQMGASRLVGNYSVITDRPHPMDAGNNSFTSLWYWNGSAWASKPWTTSFCLNGDGTSGATSTIWISCPGTYNPETTNWAVLFAGTANWGNWRLAFNNEAGLMTTISSANGTGSDTKVLIYTK